MTPSVLPRQGHSSSQWHWVAVNLSTLLLPAASSAQQQHEANASALWDDHCPVHLPTVRFPLFPVFRYSLHHGARHDLIRTFLVSFPNPWQSFAARYLCWSLSSPQGLLSQHFHLTQPVMLAQAAVAVPPSGLWDPSITKRVTHRIFLCSHLLFSAMCWSPPALPTLSSKSYYSESKQEYMCLSPEQCVGTALLFLMLILLATQKNGAL